jgi:uncharacterized protein (TIGR02391 family)
MSDESRCALALAQRLQGASSPPASPDRLLDGLGPVVLYDALVTDAQLRRATRRLFADGHYSQAVLEGCKYLCRRMRARTGLDVDGADLMRTALSPSKPLLRLNPMRTQSDRDEQRGYMELLAGLMTAVRNPRAHDDRADDAMDALGLLVTIHHCLSLVCSATRTRRRALRSARGVPSSQRGGGSA